MTSMKTSLKASAVATLLGAGFAFSTVSASAMDCSGGYAHMKTKTSETVAEAPVSTPLPDNSALAMSAPTDDALLLLNQSPSIAE